MFFSRAWIAESVTDTSVAHSLWLPVSRELQCYLRTTSLEFQLSADAC